MTNATARPSPRTGPKPAAHPLPALLLSLLLLLATGCITTAAAQPDAAGGCPRAVSKQLDSSAKPRRHDVLLLDLSASVGRSSDSFAAQVSAITADAVRAVADLRVAVVGRAANPTVVLVCPALAGVVQDPSAARRVADKVVRLTASSVLDALRAVPDDTRGSDVRGALVAESVAGHGPAPRRIVVLSDGENVGDNTGAALSLPGVTVQMYGVGGAARGGTTTARANSIRSSWLRMLDAAGARATVEFGDYTPQATA